MPSFYAVTTPGLEPVTARELADLGVDGQIEPGGVRFEAPLADGAALAAVLRTPGRLLLELQHAPARSLDGLAQLVRGIDWAPLLPRHAAVEVAVSARKSRLRFKDAVAKKVGHAIADVVGRPHEGRGTTAQRVQVRLDEDVATISLDAGGELLHRRGWRLATAKAPLRENLAAAMLVMAGFDGDEALVDPFCGAGTLPIEAARMAAGLPPGQDRAYGFQAWPALAGWRPDRVPPRGGPMPLVLGADRDPGAIRASIDNATRARVTVDWRQLDVRELEPPAPTGLVVANPPYGVRVGKGGAGGHPRAANPAGGAYAAFGQVLRERFGGWRALFLAPDPSLARKVHREAAQLTSFSNGGIRVGVWVIELS